MVNPTVACCQTNLPQKVAEEEEQEGEEEEEDSHYSPNSVAHMWPY